METMQTWFGLKANHNDFTIETDADAELFFARHELDEQLKSMLRRAFRTSNPPKIVLYGDWGVGKTHTMRHIEYVIENTQNYNAVVVFVELPDITAKSTFQVAHSALLDAIGLDQAKHLTLQFQTKHPDDAQTEIREFTQSGDVAIAFANLLALGEGGRIAWDWLRGIPLSASDAKLVGLPTALTQSNHLVKVLQMFGRLVQEVQQKLLVLMLDEATKLVSVTNQDAVNHWLNAFKLIADQQTKEIGFIISGSWIDPDDMALPLQDQQVMSRFGEPSYIRLQNLDEQDTRDFIVALLSTWIDPDRRQQITTDYGGEADGEEVSEDSFPFTLPALEVAVQYACRHGGYTTPRDIQVTIDDLLNRAIDDDRRIVSSQYINSLVAG